MVERRGFGMIGRNFGTGISRDGRFYQPDGMDGASGFQIPERCVLLFILVGVRGTWRYIPPCTLTISGLV